MMQGRLGGLIILPVDQGFEHGPARSFAVTPAAYDPHFHFKLATQAELSALAALLGFLEAGASTFGGRIPTILKLNNANSLSPQERPPPKPQQPVCRMLYGWGALAWALLCIRDQTALPT